jgi:hypothetical protein
LQYQKLHKYFLLYGCLLIQHQPMQFMVPYRTT